MPDAGRVFARVTGAVGGPGKTGTLVRSPGMTLSKQAQEGHLVDALALRGDEGRSTLR
jgi:hypothetical protein